jgi:hypothetical protein
MSEPGAAVDLNLEAHCFDLFGWLLDSSPLIEPSSPVVTGVGKIPAVEVSRKCDANARRPGKKASVRSVFLRNQNGSDSLPVAASRQIAAGGLLCPDHRDGKITWEQWLERTYGPKTV